MYFYSLNSIIYPGQVPKKMKHSIDCIVMLPVMISAYKSTHAQDGFSNTFVHILSAIKPKYFDISTVSKHSEMAALWKCMSVILLPWPQVEL